MTSLSPVELADGAEGADGQLRVEAAPLLARLLQAPGTSVPVDK